MGEGQEVRADFRGEGRIEVDLMEGWNLHKETARGKLDHGRKYLRTNAFVAQMPRKLGKS